MNDCSSIPVYVCVEGLANGPTESEVTMATEAPKALPDCIVQQLRAEAVEAGDEKTASDCDIVLHEEPSTRRSDAALTRLHRVLAAAAAQ